MFGKFWMVFKIFDTFNKCSISTCHEWYDSFCPIFIEFLLMTLLSPKGFQNEWQSSSGSTTADKNSSSSLQCLIDILIHFFEFWYFRFENGHCIKIQLFHGLNSKREIILCHFGKTNGFWILLFSQQATKFELVCKWKEIVSCLGLIHFYECIANLDILLIFLNLDLKLSKFTNKFYLSFMTD